MGGKTVEKAWKGKVRLYPDEAERVSEVAEAINVEVFFSEENNKTYCARLRELLEEYRLIEGLQLIKKNDEVKLKWNYITEEIIADLMFISRGMLSHQLNGKGFLNHMTNDQKYINTRVLYLKLFSLFFGVSPRYLIGLQLHRDMVVDGGVTMMVFIDEDIALGISVFRAKCAEAVGEEALKEYMKVLESLKVFADIADAETAKHLLKLLFMLPEVKKDKKSALPDSAKKIREKNEEYVYKWSVKRAEDVLGFDLNHVCGRIGSLDLRLLYELGKLFYNGKWDLLTAFAKMVSASGLLSKETANK